jgi:hypothetical protein
MTGEQALQWISSIVGVILGLTSLIVSIVALRLTKEQARAYLFPVPAIYAEESSGALWIRNFGTGAMLNLWFELDLLQAGNDPVTVRRSIPFLGPNDAVDIVGREILGPMALTGVRGLVTYDNIGRHRLSTKVLLNSLQLEPLEGA